MAVVINIVSNSSGVQISDFSQPCRSLHPSQTPSRTELMLSKRLTHFQHRARLLRANPAHKKWVGQISFSFLLSSTKWGERGRYMQEHSWPQSMLMTNMNQRTWDCYRREPFLRWWNIARGRWVTHWNRPCFTVKSQMFACCVLKNFQQKSSDQLDFP